MHTEEFSFLNRHGLKIVGTVLHPANPKGLAFVQHGLTSARNRPHIQLIARLLSEHDYTVVTFDCTNAFGESDGTLETVTQTSYIQDLEDVIAYAAKQSFYQEPFLLSGHSMGACSSLQTTINHPEKVKAILAFSSVVSGKLISAAFERFKPEEMKEWKEKGFVERVDRMNPSVKGNLPWTLMEDWLKYDLLEKGATIKCPVFLAVGENDTSTMPADQQALFDVLSCPKDLVVIPNCEHTFREPHELKAFEEAIRKGLTMVG